MSVQTEIDRIKNAKTAISTAIASKGVNVPNATLLDGMAALIEAIESGVGGDDGSFKEVIERTAVNPTLPSDLTRIGDSAFYKCRNLALTSLPASVTSIDSNAFYNCTNLALTSLPDGVTSIGSKAFHDCTNLALTSLPDGVTSIDSNAFRNCTNLALTSLPASVIVIEGYAFYNCTNLAELTFKGKPFTISKNAFMSCTNLLTINVPWAVGEVSGAPWGAKNATINYNYVEEG